MAFSVDLYHRTANTPYCSIKKLTHNEQLMGEDYVTVSMESPTLKADGSNEYFMVGDWLVYRGVKYVVDVPPTLQKQARVKSKGNAIVFDSVKLVNELCFAMSYVEFRDVVNGTEHYNFAARNFSFYCVDLCSFAERVKANLDRDFKDVFHIYVHGTLNGVGYNYQIGTNKPEGFAPAGKKNITISISDSKLWDSLSNVKEEFDVNFVVRNDDAGVMSIFLGANGNLLAQQHFSYGKNNGLFKFERTTDTSQAIVTKLRAYGAETNMPTRYYRNVGSERYIDLSGKTDITMKENWHCIVVPVDGKNGHATMYATAFTSNAGIEPIVYNLWQIYITGYEIPKTWYDITIRGGFKSNKQQRGTLTFNAFAGINNGYLFIVMIEDSDAGAFWEDYYDEAYNLFYVSYGANKNSWPAGWSIITSMVPNNMNVKCLMLPGFGFRKLKSVVEAAFSDGSAATIQVLKKYYNAGLSDKGLSALYAQYTFSEDETDPWVAKTKSLEKYGCREGFKVFDTKDKDYDPIYPSIQYVGDESNKLPEQSVTIDGETVGNGLRVDDGICDDLVNDNKNIPEWYLYVKNPGFDPYKQRPDGSSEITISFKNGMLGGREFKCKKSKAVTFSNGTTGYQLTLDRIEDSTLDVYFPYEASAGKASFIPKEGDEFVYLDIEMPDTYVEDAALRELLPAALEVLDKNCDVQYKYNLTIDDIRMARQHDEAMSSGGSIASLHDTMRAGDVLLFGDGDLGVDYNNDLIGGNDTISAAILIDSVEIHENEGALPKYTVNLVETKVISTIQKMQKQIDSIVSSTAGSTTGGGGGYSAGEIQQMISTYGSKWFLSRTHDDEAAGNIKFDQNVDVVGDETVGGDLDVGGNLDVGESVGVGGNLVVDGNETVKGVLHVTKLEADTLEIMEAKHISGKVVSSPAGAVIKGVEEKTNYWDIFFDLYDEDGKEVKNMFAENDMVWCEIFEVNSEGKYVSKASSDDPSITSRTYWRLITAVGKNDEFNFIRISKQNYCSFTDTPEVGDTIVVLGSVTNKDRRGATISSPVGTFTYKGRMYDAPYECQYVGIGANGFVMPDPKNAKSPKLTVVNADVINLESGGTIGGADEWKIYSVDWETEVEYDEDGNASLKFETLEPKDVDVSEDWTEEEYPGHLGDYIITANGYCYVFSTNTDGDYFWKAVLDELLLDLQSKLNGIQKSGFVSESNFAAIWSRVIKTEDGKGVLSDAGVMTKTDFDQETNSWWSSVKIWGDRIEMTAAHKMVLNVGKFIVLGSNFSVDEEGRVTALNGKFKGIQLSQPNYINPENFATEMFSRFVTNGSVRSIEYDYDFVDRGKIAIFEGDLSEKITDSTPVCIILPGSDSSFSKYSKLACIQLIGERFYVANNTTSSKIGIKNGSKPTFYIQSGSYAVYEMEKKTDNSLVWNLLISGSMSDFTVTDS